jgi:membrane protein YdbS with pleckstrin-like domain
LADRLLSRIAGRPHTSHEAIILAVFMVTGAAAVSLWAFGVGIGLDPVPTWLNLVTTGAVAVTLLGVVVALALISDRRQRERARE